MTILYLTSEILGLTQRRKGAKKYKEQEVTEITEDKPG
jgi:hypothetical protein